MLFLKVLLMAAKFSLFSPLSVVAGTMPLF
jgi:hypothetical protein